MTTKFHGVIPPVVTPLTPNGDLDVASYEKLINRLIGRDRTSKVQCNATG